MKSISFLIDGFNVYHSVDAAAQKLGNNEVKWLDYSSLCQWIATKIWSDSKINNIYWFTSIPYHYIKRNPDKIKRHKLYIKIMRDKGVRVIEGKYREVTKEIYLNGNKHLVNLNEEKQTDVAIGVQLLDEFIRYNADIAVIISGDTDFIPAIKKAQDIFHGKEIWVAFPYQRFNGGLQLAVQEKHLKLKAGHYKDHIMDNPVVLNNGMKVFRPAHWE